LDDKETIKIVGHSQGTAFAAGIVSVLAKHEKYSSRIEMVYYISSQQPAQFSHPENVPGIQFSTKWDQVSGDTYSPISLFNGGSHLEMIKGIKPENYIVRDPTDDLSRGHFVNTYLDYLGRYFTKRLGIPVQVFKSW
jgi:hypothetical protein